MKTNENSTRWLGMALAGSILTFVASAQAGKPVRPPKPPPEPILTYTLIPFDNGEWLGSRAVGIAEAGLVPGYFEFEYIWNTTNKVNLPWPTIATVTDANGDGVLDLPVELPVLEGHIYGLAVRANESGVIVGQTGRLVEEGEWPPASVYKEGVVWVPGPGGYAIQGLGVIDARLREAGATCVNNDGVIVGGCTWGNTFNWQRAFIIVPEDTVDGRIWFRDANGDGVNDLMLPIWPGPDPSKLPGDFAPMDAVARIVGINDAGVVAGCVEWDYQDAYPSVFAIVPDYRDDDGDGNPWFKADDEGDNRLVKGLPPLSADAFTLAREINASGEIAGSSDDHAVIWRPDANGDYSIQDLGAFSQRDHLQVVALSDTGWLVGWAYNLGTGASSPRNHPKPDLTIVWHDGVMHVLQEILTNGDGWTGLRFSDVSNEGVLVGYGSFDGKVTACLAVPNVP